MVIFVVANLLKKKIGSYPCSMLGISLDLKIALFSLITYMLSRNWAKSKVVQALIVVDLMLLL
jgi:uncharacterized membrane protein